MSRFRALLVLVCLGFVGASCVTPPPGPAPTPAPPCDVLLVGDSMLRYPTDHVGLVDTFAAAGCPAEVDAQVARPTTVAADVIEARAADGTLPTLIGITSAGWDAYIGAFDSVGPSVDRVMAAAGGRQVVWVNAFVLNGTTNDQVVNAILAAKATEYPNLTVLDHYSWVSANQDLLIDFAHLSTAGEQQWTQRLLAATQAAAVRAAAVPAT
ncbi:MAG: hypothetical protein ACKOYM_01000 [Actinomycetes bacterium]